MKKLDAIRARAEAVDIYLTMSELDRRWLLERLEECAFALTESKFYISQASPDVEPNIINKALAKLNQEEA